MELTEVAKVMLIKKIDCLPIVSDGKFVGIINFSDVIRCKESLEQFKIFANSASSDELQKAIDAITPAPLYGRIDFVRDAAGDFAVMEFELIEPSLYLRMDPGAPERFARAIDAWYRAAAGPGRVRSGKRSERKEHAR